MSKKSENKNSVVVELKQTAASNRRLNVSQAKTDTPCINELGQRKVPVNLRQSGNSDAEILTSTRLRKSPYWHRSHEAGCWSYTVYNRMFHPRAYVSLKEGGLMREYEYLTKHVTLWNVAVERQIQVKGPDAQAFVNMLVTRDITKNLPVDRCRYVILCNEKGGIINDPVLLRVEEDEYWLSISDSDVLLWAQGVNTFGKFNVEINEIDVAPVQIQGPKSKDLMHKIFGQSVLEIPYYGLLKTKMDGLDVVVSRTGFSAEVGFEIYLRDATVHADKMWDRLLEAGEEFNLKVIAPSHIRRLEAGILSYGQDMDIETNPYEVKLGWQVDQTKDKFIGKEALAQIKERGVERKLVGLRLGGEPIVWYNPDFYHVQDADSDALVGYISSCFYSPTLKTNIGLAMVPKAYAATGTEVTAMLPNNGPVEAMVVDTPFVDPKKKKPAQKLKLG